MHAAGSLGISKVSYSSASFRLDNFACRQISARLTLNYFLGGKLLLELDRVLRPGGYFVWSATPVYRKDPEDTAIWKGAFTHVRIVSIN